MIALGFSVVPKPCCNTVSDFGNVCAPEARSCAPEGSHVILTCDCVAGCWNGTACQ
jgi:hypothetical protein